MSNQDEPSPNGTSWGQLFQANPGFVPTFMGPGQMVPRQQFEQGAETQQTKPFPGMEQVSRQQQITHTMNVQGGRVR